MDEFDLINRYLAPLSNGDERARGLKDDVAFMSQHNLLVTKDILQAGVHFHATDPMDMVAQKALRVNLSDIFSKGGQPFGYFLGLMIPDSMPESQIRSFTEGLKADQIKFGLSLLGGDTIASKGPPALSVTMLAHSPDIPPSRSGARPGDLVYVTGTIGDSWLGLACIAGISDRRDIRRPAPSCDIELNSLSPAQRRYVETRYLRPEPRAAFARGNLYQQVTASIDISDGLIADTRHIAHASRIGIEIDLAEIPLSAAAQAYVTGNASPRTALVNLGTGGDDYEILCTIDVADKTEFETKAAAAGLEATRIGRCIALPAGTEGHVCALYRQVEITLPAGPGGYRHFSCPS